MKVWKTFEDSHRIHGTGIFYLLLVDFDGKYINPMGLWRIYNINVRINSLIRGPVRMLASMWISKHSDSWSDILMYFALWLWTITCLLYSMFFFQLEHMKWSWGHVHVYYTVYHKYPFPDHFVCSLMDPRGCQDMPTNIQGFVERRELIQPKSTFLLLARMSTPTTEGCVISFRGSALTRIGHWCCCEINMWMNVQNVMSWMFFVRWVICFRMEDAIAEENWTRCFVSNKHADAAFEWPQPLNTFLCVCLVFSLHVYPWYAYRSYPTLHCAVLDVRPVCPSCCCTHSALHIQIVDSASEKLEKDYPPGN